MSKRIAMTAWMDGEGFGVQFEGDPTPVESVGLAEFALTTAKLRMYDAIRAAMQEEASA